MEWHIKIQYVLEKQEATDVLNHDLDEPEEENTVQHRKDRKAYEAWNKKNSKACITLLSSMEDDIMHEFWKLDIAKEIWDSLKVKFGGTSYQT